VTSNKPLERSFKEVAHSSSNIQELMDIEFSCEESLVLLCCCIAPSDDNIRDIDTILLGDLDWDYIFRISTVHGISGFLYNNLSLCKNKDRIPVSITEKLKKEYFRTAYANLILVKEYASIVQHFNRSGVEIMPLKGLAYLNTLYNNTGLRPCADIDILVRKNDLQKARQLLHDIAYLAQEEHLGKKHHHFHSSFWCHKGGMTIVVELHWHIDFPNSPFKINIDDFWKRASRIDDGTKTYYIPSLEDTILLNSFHLGRDISRGVNEILPIKNFIDLAEIINRYNNEINWETIQQAAADYNIARTVFVVLLLLEKLLSVSMPINLMDILLRSGFDKIFIAYLVREYVFTKTVCDDVPAWLIDIKSEKTFLKKLNVALSFFKIIYQRYTDKHYVSRRQSMVRTIADVTLEYIGKVSKTLFLFLVMPRKAKRMYAISLEKSTRKKEIIQWILR
jgi:hypothetical protein